MENTNNKKLPIIGIISAIGEGIPALMQLIRPFIRRKKTIINDDELNKKSREELFNIIKQSQQNDNNESTLMYVVKTLTTFATIYGVLWLSKEFGITRDEIIHMFGLF